MSRKMWYLFIRDFVGNEENYVFADKAEAYKSFAIVLHRELVSDENTNENGELIDANGHNFHQCMENGSAETSAYIIVVKECELATSKQFMW